MSKLRVLDLFSGIGGFSLGLERAGGFQTVAFCEIEPFCQRVLAKHWPEVPNLGDVERVEFQPGSADVIVGGFPCQDVSLAGKRAGLSGARSGLYRELVRALRVVRPRHAIVENVAALLGDGLGTVLGDLAESGFDAEWDCVPAKAFGAPHERDRVYIVAHAADADCLGRESVQAGALQHGSAVCDQERIGAGGAPGREVVQSWAAGGACPAPDAPRLGCGQGRTWRPPDSFARIRDEARRNAADPYGARLAFREGLGRDAWEERSAAKRDAGEDGGQSIWPDEPALLGVDDDVPDRVDRTRALGNTIIPIIPELIGRVILEAEEAMNQRPQEAA
jgi:DNA (cytosine-5)-methyltransferase 1